MSFAARSIRPLESLVLLSATVFLAACGQRTAGPPETEPATADLVLKNARVYTVDGARSWAEAVGIADGRIVFVGTDLDAQGVTGPSTQVVDLDGRMMLPGFQDVHIHPISSGIEAASCDLHGMTTVEDYVAAVDAYAKEHPNKEWITGGGWVMSAFGPGANASKKLLDAVVPDRPAILYSTDGHSAWANSKALEIAGITKDTPDPVDGVIDRDPATGEPIGSLQEGAMSLVDEHMPPVDLEARLSGLRYSVNMLNGYGVTSIQDANVNEDSLKAYEALDERGGLTLRVVGAQWWERDGGLEQVDKFKRLRKEYTKGHVRATTVKIMQDGVMENFTAAMLEPYLGQNGKRGIPMVDPEFLKKVVTRLDAEDFQVHFHAIGDAAIREALDAIEAARDANGDRGNRDHISHLELIDPADIPRFRELNVVANFQPVWAFADDYITDLTIPFIGPDRSKWLYPIGSVVRAGGMIAFGSDWSVSTANPMEEMETAVTRMGPLGETTEPFLPEQRIDLPLAIAAFTINAAYVNTQEKDTGSIEVGKYADLIVLDRNLFAIDPTEISDTKVMLTLLGGKVVHGKLASL